MGPKSGNRLVERITRAEGQPLTVCQRSIQQSVATMDPIPRTPKRRRQGREENATKRKKLSNESFLFPLVNFPAEPPTTPIRKRQPVASLPSTPQQSLLLSPQAEGMTHYRTRSVVAREKDRIQRAALPHPDSEMIKGEVTTTGLGIHLRWEYPECGASLKSDKGTDPSCTPSRPSHCSRPPIMPLSDTCSHLSISSTLSCFSSINERDMTDPSLRTPNDDSLKRTYPHIRTPSPCPRRIQRRIDSIGPSAVYPWAKSRSVSDDESLPIPLDAKCVERDLRIGTQQLRRLEALKKAREEQWAQAAEAGLFDEFDTSDEESEGSFTRRIEDAEVEAELFRTFETKKPTMEGSSRNVLGRTDTIQCSSEEPPSKLRPTLPKPILPYFRTETQSSLSTTSSTCTTSTMSTASMGCISSPRSICSMASTSSSSSRRYVRRYQENGVWKTDGTFKDLPALAHLESFDSMQSLEQALPPKSPRTPLKAKAITGKNRLEALRVEHSPFKLPQARSRVTSDAAKQEQRLPNPRLRAAPRHSFST
ncbi:hypothetical protein BDY19DRAFT_1057571 [Irpex rosettiformis]|uniref:Uncharacterized protein n=1 Tax=Irpex rosettiformis TaxID=378272 RepID=A0ACB8U2I2_9APHY|nr:hypothetical protein BDY19DRAFT_1057571 [Irpex rosettiformis]